MAKIDLKKSSGFALFIEQGILTSPDLQPSRTKKFLIEDIREQLLNQELSYPEEIYTKYYNLDHDSVFSSKNFKVNVFTVPPNLAGIEYIKTKALRSSKHNRIFEVFYGGGTLILQNYQTSVDDVVISKIKRDQKVIIPKGYAATLVNTRQSQLVVAEIMSVDAKNSTVLDEMRGMAYYVIRKNAKHEVVRNPFYKDVESFRKVKWDNIVQKYGITLKTPIIKQILRKYEKFNWLFDETEIPI